jgi:hemoglobin/transferrin/lactoferrin receptor protein
MSHIRIKALSGAAMAALLSLAGAATTTSAHANAAATARFDVPAGPLGAAIARLGRQAGVLVTVDPALVRGRSTRGLSGQYGTLEALERLLGDSGLRAQADGRGGYRLIPVAAATSSAPIRTAPAADEAPTLTDSVTIVGALTDVEIDAATIELRQANSLADLFRQTPSVTVGGSVSIAQKVYVRGLEDSLLNVTVDGAPQRGTLFHHIGRVSIEPELLDAVEVQAGAGEATAGFGAIGGAIRFRTKDADDLLRPGQRFGALAKAGYFSNDGHKLSGTVYGRLFGDVGFVGSMVRVDRDDMKDGGGQRLRGTSAEQNLAYAKLGGDLGGGHRFSLSYEHREEKAAFGQRPNWPVLAGDRLFPAEGKRQTAVANYGVTLAEGVDLEATGYWTRSRFTQDRYDRWGLYGAAIRSAGFDVRGRIQRGDHDVAVGTEYRSDRIHSQYLAAPTVWGRWAWSPTVGRFEEKGDVFGVYAQDHWRIGGSLLLSYGVRYDAYDVTQITYANGAKSDGVSFNAGLEYELSQDLTFSVGYAEAFRGKEIGDAFTLEKRPGRISLSPTLKPETVGNYELGLTWDRGPFRASAVYYSMTIDDVIFDQLGSGAPPQDAVYYENVGRFKAQGVELRAGYSSGPFSVDAYYNHYESTLNGDTIEGYEHIGLGNSVGDNWNLTAGYEPSSKLRFETSLTRYADLNNIEVLQRGVAIGWIGKTQYVDKPGYTVVDVVGSWKPFGDDRVTLLAGVYNLFDTRYRAHSSVADYNHIPGWEGIAGVYEPGRDIRLTAAFRY